MSKEEKLAKVPVEARLDIATTGMMGAVSALSLALEQAVGKEKYMEFADDFWKMAGKGSKQIIDTFQLPVDTIKDFSETLSCIGTLAIGPGYESRIHEADANHCTGRTIKCPFRDGHVASGRNDYDGCTQAPHSKFVEGLLEALDLDYRFSITNGMATGGSYCEWTVEKP
jgi:hypothetical protein